MSELFHALIVEDDFAVRQALARALTRESFRCDLAADGHEAEAMLSGQTYDVVITDLRMPNVNGHALAMSLLELKPPPLIVVLTGVCEPALAKDLLARGVDDVMFKPVDYGLFCSKVASLHKRRQAALLPAIAAPATSDGSAPAAALREETCSTAAADGSEAILPADAGTGAPASEPAAVGSGPVRATVDLSSVERLALRPLADAIERNGAKMSSLNSSIEPLAATVASLEQSMGHLIAKREEQTSRRTILFWFSGVFVGVLVASLLQLILR